LLRSHERLTAVKNPHGFQMMKAKVLARYFITAVVTHRVAPQLA
jgi:hypothetical protein